MAKKQKSPDSDEEEEPTPLLDLAAARLVENPSKLKNHRGMTPPVLIKTARF